MHLPPPRFYPTWHTERDFAAMHMQSGPLPARSFGAPAWAAPLPRDCMDRTHGGRVFGDMVDTFEYVRHRA